MRKSSTGLLEKWVPLLAGPAVSGSTPHLLKRSLAAAVLVVNGLSTPARAEPAVSFTVSEDRVEIRVGDRPFATYVFRDPKILRPYFAHVRSSSGAQVTRNHPPSASEPADHDTMHPGMWLAFGDLAGADFWRNKAHVKHVEFVDNPKVDRQGGSFEVTNVYASGDKTICQERCRVAVRPMESGTRVVLDSRFTGRDDFYFGDQEEMGLGVRVATPMAVKQGGQLTSSEGRSGEMQVWGRQADWCDYSGVVDGRHVGVMIIPDPQNFRRSWFHARDYGFVAANPFGHNAFTKGEKSRVIVRAGESLRLRFVVAVHEGSVDRAEIYEAALAQLKTP